MANFNNLNSALSLRRMPSGGPNRSKDINDSLDEILHDVATIYNFINGTAIPVLNGLGRPGTYSDFDVVADGLDGTTLVTDRAWTDATSPYFYTAAQGRPATAYETFAQVVADLNRIFENINQINARLGSSSTEEAASLSTLSELESEVNYFIGVTRTLQTANDGYLNATGISAAIADQTINPASFNIEDSDVIAIAAIAPTKISGVDLTTGYTYSGGEPATYDIRDSILRVKEFVEDTTGDSITSFANSGLTGDSLKTHREKVGTGTPSVTNPHGLDVSDLDDVSSLLAQPVQIADFAFKLNNTTTSGGYFYVNRAYTVTSMALTVADGGSAGLTAGVYRTRGTALIASGTTTTGSPGFTYVTTINNSDLENTDLLYIDSISGDGLEARVTLWGTRS